MLSMGDGVGTAATRMGGGRGEERNTKESSFPKKQHTPLLRDPPRSAFVEFRVQHHGEGGCRSCWGIEQVFRLIWSFGEMYAGFTKKENAAPFFINLRNIPI